MIRGQRCYRVGCEGTAWYDAIDSGMTEQLPMEPAHSHDWGDDTMQMCQYCGTVNRADDAYCKHCGGALSPGLGNAKSAPDAQATVLPPTSIGSENAAAVSVSVARQHTVFVSHAHSDNLLCDPFVAALRARGLDVWYDRMNMQGGQRLSKVIEHELETRTAFVVMLTPASVASYWVGLETDAFRDMAAHDPVRLMLPVRIAVCNVPLLMRGLIYTDAVTLGFDAAVDKVVTALGAPCEAEPTTFAVVAGSQRDQSFDELLFHGKALIAQKKYAEAIPFLERASKLDPHSADAWDKLKFAYLEADRIPDALRAVNRETDIQEATHWYGEGDWCLDMGRPEEALAAYDRALTFEPNLAAAWYNRAIALRMLGRIVEAEQAERRARELG